MNKYQKRLETPEKLRAGGCPFVISYRGKPITTYKAAWRDAVMRAGIRYEVVPYDVRHLVATILVQGGGSVKEVAGILGHSTKMLLDTYCQGDNEARREAVALLPELEKKEKGA